MKKTRVLILGGGFGGLYAALNIDPHWVETRRGVTPPVSWHLRSEEQKAIADAWNTISNGAQIAVVLERLPSKDVDDEEEDY
jgi:NADH dehydrogenase FAD-containing subunit